MSVDAVSVIVFFIMCLFLSLSYFKVRSRDAVNALLIFILAILKVSDNKKNRILTQYNFTEDHIVNDIV